MGIINSAYGKFFSAYPWNYFATIRPHYNLTTYGSQNMMKRLVKAEGVERVFFTLEQDFNPSGIHAYLLIETKRKLNIRKVAELLKTKPITISYFQKIESIEDTVFYTTKYIGMNVLHYDYFERDQF